MFIWQKSSIDLEMYMHKISCSFIAIEKNYKQKLKQRFELFNYVQKKSSNSFNICRIRSH